MSADFQQIRKRNGDFVSFDETKIATAITKAFFEVTGSPHTELAHTVTEHVVTGLNAAVVEHGPTYIPGVEDVQDMVEKALMEQGFFDVAKAYIIYRFERSEERQEKKEEVREKVEHNELLVEKRDGTKELFSVSKIRKILDFAVRGHESVVDVDMIVRQLAAEVHDGIRSKDIARTLVMVARSFIERDPAYSIVASRLIHYMILYKQVVPGVAASDEKFVDAYRTAFETKIRRGVELNLLDERMLTFDFGKLKEAFQPERDDLLKYLGTQTLLDRYFIRDKSNADQSTLLESPQIMWMRIAMGLAFDEKEKEEKAISFYNILSTLRFVSSTPTLFHAGTPHPQLSSCYLSTVDDSLESIFARYSSDAQLSKWSGGIGNDWTNIRATGAKVKTSGIESNGLIPFLKIADSTTVAINRSGRRRGASAVYLESWHLDIEDFLNLRKNTGDDRRRTHDINTANWIPDLFMKRIRDDGDWTLFSPDDVPDLHHIYGSAFEKRYHEYEKKAQDGEIRLHRTIKARELWRKMITMLFETGHAWITFKDPCNVRSPQDHVGVVHSSNLCTEITLNTEADKETAVCNLGSVNLAQHVIDGKFDRVHIEDTVRTAMRMLDNVIDLNFYPTEEARRSNMRHRPVGLGVMGFQDALYLQDINFGSQQAVDFADYSMEVVSYYAILGSSELAKERGAYKTYKGSKWDRGLLPLDTLTLLEEERGEAVPVARGSLLDWTPVREHIKQHGMRNSNTMAIAPTATISNIAGCFPTVEPIYKNMYVKANISGEFAIVNPFLVADLKELGLWNDEMIELIKGHDGCIDAISSLPQSIKDKHKEVFDIDPKHLVKVAAHRMKWIDQSQSYNVFYKGTSGKGLSDVYHYAWQMGLKTTYYLRTLGATSIEKSTVQLDKQDVDSSVKHTASELAEQAVQAVEKKVPVAASTLKKDGGKPKLCAIKDPDCEACQ